MLNTINPENIGPYLNKVENLFPEFMETSTLTRDDIKAYYADSFWGYKIFHSWSGAVHMALSPSGRFSRRDYLKQAQEVGETLSHIGSGNPLNILEVGCGKGFNLRFLAKKFPAMSFVGIDLTPQHVSAARKKLAKQPNATVKIDDFQELSHIPGNTIDMVFAVETLCHATNLPHVMGAISRVLKDGGIFIVYDGFRKGITQPDSHLGRALAYSEKAMAVPVFHQTEAFIAAAQAHNLTGHLAEDRSREIMPNLIRLSNLARMFFKLPVLSKIILAIAPRALAANAVAGLLMAITVQSGAHTYIKLSFQKTPSPSRG